MVVFRRLFLFSMIFTGVFGSAFCMDIQQEEDGSSDEYEMVDVAAQRRENFDTLIDEVLLTIISYESSLNVTGKRAVVSKGFGRLIDTFLFNENDEHNVYGGDGCYDMCTLIETLSKPNKVGNRSKFKRIVKVIRNCSLHLRLFVIHDFVSKNRVRGLPIFGQRGRGHRDTVVSYQTPPFHISITQEVVDGERSPFLGNEDTYDDQAFRNLSSYYGRRIFDMKVFDDASTQSVFDDLKGFLTDHYQEKTTGRTHFIVYVGGKCMIIAVFPLIYFLNSIKLWCCCDPSRRTFSGSFRDFYKNICEAIDLISHRVDDAIYLQPGLEEDPPETLVQKGIRFSKRVVGAGKRVYGFCMWLVLDPKEGVEPPCM